MYRSTAIVLLLTIPAELATLDVGDINTSPQNIIGLVGDAVILECRRNVTPEEIAWKYIPPGSDEEYDIPSGRYRFEMNYYGIHRLILEQLQLADAGVYVCRNVQDKFEAAAAYVLVTHGPFCFSNLTTYVQELTDGAAVKMTCVVTYASIPGVNPTLTWTQTGGTFSLSKRYTSSVKGVSFHSLTSVVMAERPSFSQYSCKVTFHHANRRPDDMAQNVPDILNGNTCVLPDRPIFVVPRLHNSARHNSSALKITENCSLDNTYKNALVIVSILTGTIIITLVLLLCCFRMHKCGVVQSQSANKKEFIINRNPADEIFRCQFQEEKRAETTKSNKRQDAWTQCKIDADVNIVSSGSPGACLQVEDGDDSGEEFERLLTATDDSDRKREDVRRIMEKVSNI